MLVPLGMPAVSTGCSLQLLMNVAVKVALQAGQLCLRLHVPLVFTLQLALEVLHAQVCLCQLQLCLNQLVQELP